MNTDKLNKLQQIASGNQYSGESSYDISTKLNSKKLKEKLNKIETEVKKMYPNNQEKIFETWVEATKNFKFPTEDFKEYYWSKYLDLNPVDTTKAKESLIKKTEVELNNLNSPTEKEYYLRDKVSRWPKWLVEEFKDDLQNFSTRNAETNLNKSKLVYRDNLVSRLSNLANKELDPDVPEEAHIDDLLKLEKMNLMDVADSINGRFGVADKNGSFVPAFDLNDRNQVFPNDIYGAPSIDEQLIIDELAPEFIKKYVSGNLNKQRTKINLDNKTSEGVALGLLETGALTPDKWNEAFSMFAKPEYTSLITKGMQGEIESGRVKTQDDLIKTLYMALSQYKDLLGEDTNATNP
jgi:hypothetical protein